MGSEKDFDNSGLNIDKEKVKPDVQEYFRYPRLIGELYKNLSLSDIDSLNALEKLSHHCTVKNLFEGMPNIDKFASSKKTLKSCFKGDVDQMLEFYMALVPPIFSSFKELYLGKTSRQDGLNRLNDEDLQEMNGIDVTPNNLSNKQIISEIRNALNHTHYVPGKKDLYIKNPKNSNPRIHARDFEASVPYTFLLEFITLAQIRFRRSDCFEFYVDDQELLGELRENNKNIKYEDVKDKIRFFHSVTKDKLGDQDSEDTSETKVRKEVVCSEQTKNLIQKYFSNHNLNKKSLAYVSESLIKPPENQMWKILETIIRKEFFGGNAYKGLNSPELLYDVYKNLIKGGYYGYLQDFDKPDEPDRCDGYDSTEVQEIIVNLLKILEKKNMPNGQSILKYFGDSLEYVSKHLKKNGFIYHKEGEVEYVEKGNIRVNWVYIRASVYGLCSIYHVIDNMIKMFPNRLRLQLIKLAYVTQQVSLSDENVDGLISKVDVSEKAKREITTREHIRNALSHHTYIILEGVDDIILRDGYKKKTDSWDREATFSLSKLFESTFKEVNEKDIDSSRSSLQELLDSLDN